MRVACLILIQENKATFALEKAIHLQIILLKFVLSLNFLLSLKITFGMKVASSEYLYVCICPILRKSGKDRKAFSVAPYTHITHLSSPSLCSHSISLHPFLGSYFVFHWTFIALLNLNPPTLSCTAYSLLPSNSLFTPPICSFFYTNHQFSLAPLLHSITHCDSLPLLILPLCVFGHHCCPCLSVCVGKWAEVGNFIDVNDGLINP